MKYLTVVLNGVLVMFGLQPRPLQLTCGSVYWVRLYRQWNSSAIGAGSYDTAVVPVPDSFAPRVHLDTSRGAHPPMVSPRHADRPKDPELDIHYLAGIRLPLPVFRLAAGIRRNRRLSYRFLLQA